MTETNEITRTVEFSLPVERLWRALTEPEQLSGWFSDHVDMDYQVGGEILFTWDQYGTAKGRIEVIEPPTRFAYRWHAHGVADQEPLSETNSTLVTFTVSPAAGGARLTVVESGFANLPEAMRARTFQENSSGWQAEFADLQAFLAGE